MVTIRKPKNALKFRSAAGWWGALWREGLPAGNGLLGASVLGGAAEDSIMLTHASSLWQGRTSVLQDVSDKIKDVRKAMEMGEPKKAQDILSDALITKNYRPQIASPLPVCDLRVKMPLSKPPKDYMRVVNMENGEVSVAYRDGNTKVERSLFVARDTDTVVYEINGKQLSCKLSFDLHDRTNNRTPVMLTRLPERVDTKYENYYMYFAARSDDGTDFGAVAKVSYYGGSQRVTEEGIEISGASSILVLVRLFTESQREKEWKALKTSLSALKLSYDKMLKSHAQLHSRLFLSCELNLEAKNRDAFCEDLLADCAKEGELSPALAEKLWGFARYLFISATRDTGLAMNPCGLWCGDYRSEHPQASAGGELEMLYALCKSGNLFPHMNAILDLVERLTPDFKKNAQRLYNCRGVMLPMYTSPNTGLPGTVDPANLHFTAGAGWVANMLYDCAAGSGDKKAMERVLSFMREVATFYEDFFRLSKRGKFRSVPSYSPENTPGNFAGEGEKLSLGIASDATIDFAVAKQLLGNLVSECTDRKDCAADVEKWKDMLSKLPDYRINADGAVAEYVSEDFTDNYEQRLCSHLYPVWVGEPMTEELKKAFLLAANKRLEHPGDMTSLGYGWLGLAFARLGAVKELETCLENVVKYTMMNNLVTAENDWRGGGFTNGNGWAFYSLAGNIGFAAAVSAGLCDGTGDRIRLLSAPLSNLEKFGLEGATTPAGVEVNFWCDRKKGNLSVSLKSRRSRKVVLELPESAKRIAKPNNLGLVLTEEKTVVLELPANKVFTIDFKI